jgi:hypothetical protein
MGRKTKELSLVCKDRIVSLFKQGLIYRKIKTLLNLSLATVLCVIKNLRQRIRSKITSDRADPEWCLQEITGILFNKCLNTPKQVLENWQKTSLQQLVNTSAFRRVEIASKKVVTKEERQDKNPLSMNETGGNGWNSHAPVWTSLSTSGKQFNSLMRVSSTYLALMVLSTFGESQKKYLDPENFIPAVKHGRGHAMV